MVQFEITQMASGWAVALTRADDVVWLWPGRFPSLAAAETAVDEFMTDLRAEVRVMAMPNAGKPYEVALYEAEGSHA